MKVSLTPFGVNLNMTPEQFAVLSHLMSNAEYEDYKAACVRNNDLIIKQSVFESTVGEQLVAAVDAGFLDPELAVTPDVEQREGIWDDEAMIKHGLDGEPFIRHELTVAFDVPVSEMADMVSEVLGSSGYVGEDCCKQS